MQARNVEIMQDYYVQYLGYPTYPNQPSPEWQSLPVKLRVSRRRSENSELSNLAWVLQHESCNDLVRDGTSGGFLVCSRACELIEIHMSTSSKTDNLIYSIWTVDDIESNVSFF